MIRWVGCWLTAAAMSVRRLHNAAEQERRFARARRVSAAYAGADGRQRFLEDDRRYLEGGIDIVKTLEAPMGASEAAASAHASGAVREFDQALRAAAGQRQMKLLELERLGPGATTVREVVDAQLRSEATEAMREPVRLLDQLEAGDDVRTLDQDDAPITHEAVVAHLRATGRPQDDYGKVLDAYVKDGALPAAPAVPEPPAVPDGFHPGSVELDKLVRARMRELGRPDSEYSNVLLEIVNEHGPMLGPPIPLSGE